MVENLFRKLLGIVFISALAAFSIWNWNIHLGLDLEGGSRIVYRFDFDQAVTDGQLQPNYDSVEVLQQTATIFQKRLDGSGMADIPIYPQGSSELVIELPGMSEEEVAAVKRTIINQGRLEFRVLAEDGDDLDLAQERNNLETWLGENTEGTINAYNALAYEDGGSRPTIRWYALTTKAAAENGQLLGSSVAGQYVPLRLENVIRETTEDSIDSWEFYGSGLNYVGPTMDQSGFGAVAFEFKEHRKAAFADFTEENKGRAMAIVLNGKVDSAPNINQRLPGAGIIQGGMNGFSQEEVRELITVLRTGSLRVKPQLESESYVGPSLGEDSINTGVWSAMAGGIAVLLFMLFYYWMNGMVAFLALSFNGFILLGALFFTQATLTLPGLAGLVLTIGMAVDANILIFERVREERKRGREVPQAYKNGYDRAFTTIVDANLTTLLTALVLYQVGTGPVQGFAAMLALGILTSMFSALVFSKVVMHYLVFTKKSVKEVKMAKALAGDAHFPFLAKRKIAAILSSVLILGGLFLFSGEASSMLGIDFAGGSAARVELSQSTDITAMRSMLPGYSVTSVQGSDETKVNMTYLVKKKLTAEQRALTEGTNMKAGSDLAADMLNELSTKLTGRLPLKADGSVDMTAAFPEKNTVGARVSGEIQNKAVQAILLSLIAIIIYMNFRFKEYRYVFAAVVALFHDVLFTLGALALFSKMGWVTVEINLEIIAAFLTIIGYSLNDTIVVFDRIRENLPRSKGSYHEIIDKSINQSLSRTILTSLTTFFVVGVLFFANRPMHNVLEGFSFAMLVGVIVGTYSSMFVASPLLVFFDRWSRKHHVKEA